MRKAHANALTDIRLMDELRDIIRTEVSEAVTRHEVMSVRQVAQFLDVAEITARQWCARGLIPATKRGSKWLVPTGLLVQQLTDEAERRQNAANNRADNNADNAADKTV